MDELPNYHDYFSWESYGNGPKVYLAFHGYGQNKKVFKDLIRDHEHEFTLYSFDLPAHGENDQSINKEEDLWNAFQQFINEHNIQNFSLISFSIGSRISHYLASKLRPAIDQVILIAPDGIYDNFWYKIATRSGWGRKLFHHMVFHPGSYLILLNVFKAIRIINSTTYKLASSQLKDQEKREKVYHTWMAMHELDKANFHMPTWHEEFKKPILLILGKKDRVIRTDLILEELKQVQNKSIIELDTSHERLFSLALKTLKENISTLLLNRQ